MIKSVTKIFLILSLFILSVVQASGTVTIKRATNFRSGSFYSDMTYLIGVLEPGTEARVLDFDNDKLYGAGVRVQVLTGQNEGRVGWIYMHVNKSKRTIDLKDNDGNPLPGRTSNFKKKVEEIRKSLPSLNKLLNSTKVSNSTRPVSDEDLWDRIYAGEYRVITPKEPGIFRPYITIAKRVVDRDGGTRVVEYTIPNRLEDFVKVTQNINSRIIGIEADCDGFDPDPQPDTPTDYSGTKGCEVLVQEVTKKSKTPLTSCLSILKKKILIGAGRGSKINRDQVYKNMYKLNKTEQRFLGLTLTGFGEAGILVPPIEEMVAVMKVLENRTEYAKAKGHEGATSLDTALQTSQFSMWHKKDPNWQRAVRASESNPHTRHSIDAYMKYETSKFENLDKVYHYHTNYVKPDWSDNSKRRNVKINGIKIEGKIIRGKRTKHEFYKSVPWTFRYTKFKPKDQR